VDFEAKYRGTYIILVKCIWTSCKLQITKNHLHENCRTFITSTFLDKEYLNNPAVSASPIPEDNERTLDCENILAICIEKGNRKNIINGITSHGVAPPPPEE
jgi:hypothetical protein